jgi:hypothetical protein
MRDYPCFGPLLLPYIEQKVCRGRLLSMTWLISYFTPPRSSPLRCNRCHKQFKRLHDVLPRIKEMGQTGWHKVQDPLDQLQMKFEDYFYDSVTGKLR